MKEKLMKQLDKISKSIDIFNRKKNSMGLNSDEQEELNKLIIDYLMMNYELIDEVFEESIIGFIDNKEIIDIKNYIDCKIGWRCNLIFREEQICEIIDKYEKLDDKLEIVKILRVLKKMENYQLDEFLKDDSNDELIKCVINLILERDGDKEYLKKYLNMRYNVIEEILKIDLGE